MYRIILLEISDKIQKLDSELKSQLELTLTLNWNFNNIKKEIDRIDIKLATPDEPRISSSTSYQRPVPHVSRTMHGTMDDIYGYSRYRRELVSASMVHTCTVSFPYIKVPPVNSLNIPRCPRIVR